MAILQKPTDREDQIQMIMDIRKVGEARAEETLNSIPFDEIWADWERAYERSFTYGIERTLGQLYNYTNPNAINPPSSSDISYALNSRRTEVEDSLKNLYNLYTGELSQWASPQVIDRYNAALASAANLYGSDILGQAGEFMAGGTTNEYTVDYIGRTTGQSQPQTFIINQETGEVTGGDIPDVQGTYDEETGGVVPGTEDDYRQDEGHGYEITLELGNVME